MDKIDVFSCVVGAFKILPQTAEIYKDGVSLCCQIQGPERKSYDIVFPILTNMSCHVSHSLCYAPPLIVEDVCGTPMLVRRLTWDEARSLIERTIVSANQTGPLACFALMRDIALTQSTQMAA